MKYKSLNGIYPVFNDIRGVYFIWRGIDAPKLAYKGMMVDFHKVADIISERCKLKDEENRPSDFYLYCKENPKEVKEVIISIWKH